MTRVLFDGAKIRVTALQAPLEESLQNNRLRQYIRHQREATSRTAPREQVSTRQDLTQAHASPSNDSLSEQVVKVYDAEVLVVFEDDELRDGVLAHHLQGAGG